RTSWWRERNPLPMAVPTVPQPTTTTRATLPALTAPIVATRGCPPGGWPRPSSSFRSQRRGGGGWHGAAHGQARHHLRRAHGDHRPRYGPVLRSLHTHLIYGFTCNQVYIYLPLLTHHRDG